MKEAELGLGPFAVKLDRSRAIDYTPPILVDYTRLVVLQPEPFADPWGFLSPFNPVMWLGILIGMVTITLLLTISSGIIHKVDLAAYFIGGIEIFFAQLSVLFGQGIYYFSMFGLH